MYLGVLKQVSPETSGRSGRLDTPNSDGGLRRSGEVAGVGQVGPHSLQSKRSVSVAAPEAPSGSPNGAAEAAIVDQLARILGEAMVQQFKRDAAAMDESPGGTHHGS